jgi:hypothetical protein
MMMLLGLAALLLQFFGTLFVWFDTERISYAIQPGRAVLTDDRNGKGGATTNPNLVSRCFSSGFCCKARTCSP